MKFNEIIIVQTFLNKNLKDISVDDFFTKYKEFETEFDVDWSKFTMWSAEIADISLDLMACLIINNREDILDICFKNFPQIKSNKDEYYYEMGILEGKASSVKLLLDNNFIPTRDTIGFCLNCSFIDPMQKLSLLLDSEHFKKEDLIAIRDDNKGMDYEYIEMFNLFIEKKEYKETFPYSNKQVKIKV